MPNPQAELATEREIYSYYESIYNQYEELLNEEIKRLIRRGVTPKDGEYSVCILCSQVGAYSDITSKHHIARAYAMEEYGGFLLFYSQQMAKSGAKIESYEGQLRDKHA